MLAILKKELKSYLLTPAGYIFIGVFLLLFSFIFATSILYQRIVNFEYLFYDGSTILTFVVPVLTMGMFAEERRRGTEQLILTSPRSVASIVFGKFFAATIIIIITELCMFMYLAILKFFGNPSIAVALNTMGGFLLLSMAYVSFGMFASSVTDNQIVAFVLTIAFFMGMWFLPYGNIPVISNIFAQVSLVDKFRNYIFGRILISELISFISFIALMICLTMVSLQRRKSTR